MTTDTDVTALDPQIVTIGERLYWRDPADGRTVPYVAGGSEPVDPPPGDPPADPPEDPPAATLTQAQFDKAMAREKAKIERKIKADLTEAAAAAKADADKAAMDEADRAKAEAAEARAEADAIRAEAAAERLAAKVERKLHAAGVADTAIARAARLVNLETDATDEDIDDEIAAIKADVPALFASSTDGDSGAKPPAGTKPPAPPKGGQPQGSPNEIAKALLRKRGITPRSEVNAA